MRTRNPWGDFLFYGFLACLVGAFVFVLIIDARNNTPEARLEQKIERIEQDQRLRTACVKANGQIVYSERGVARCELKGE